MERHIRLAALYAGILTAGALVTAAPGSADDPIAAGSSCPSTELGNSATAVDGSAVRCLATEQGGFTWTADTGAAGTIADLQKQGFTVTIDRVGGGPISECKVTGVRNPVTVTQATSNPPGPHTPGGVTVITLSKTISVSLDCNQG